MVKINWDGKSNIEYYVLQYEDDGKVIEIVSEELATSICEVGDEVQIIVDNGKVIQSDIKSKTNRRSRLMIFVFVVLVVVVLLLAYLFISIKSTPFRIALAIGIIVIIILINIPFSNKKNQSR